jgi:hypothetical protein
LRPELAKKFRHARTSVLHIAILRLTRLDFEVDVNNAGFLVGDKIGMQ